MPYFWDIGPYKGLFKGPGKPGEAQEGSGKGLSKGTFFMGYKELFLGGIEGLKAPYPSLVRHRSVKPWRTGRLSYLPFFCWRNCLLDVKALIEAKSIGFAGLLGAQGSRVPRALAPGALRKIDQKWNQQWVLYLERSIIWGIYI